MNLCHQKTYRFTFKIHIQELLTDYAFHWYLILNNTFSTNWFLWNEKVVKLNLKSIKLVYVMMAAFLLGTTWCPLRVEFPWPNSHGNKSCKTMINLSVMIVILTFLIKGNRRRAQELHLCLSPLSTLQIILANCREDR